MSLIFESGASDCIERDFKGIGDRLSGRPVSLQGEGCGVVVLLAHNEMHAVAVIVDSGTVEGIVVGNAYQSLCGDVGTMWLDGSDPRKAIAGHKLHNFVRQIAPFCISPKLLVEAHVEARAAACFDGTRRAACKTAKKTAALEKFVQAPPSL